MKSNHFLPPQEICVVLLISSAALLIACTFSVSEFHGKFSLMDSSSEVMLNFFFFQQQREGNLTKGPVLSKVSSHPITRLSLCVMKQHPSDCLMLLAAISSPGVHTGERLAGRGCNRFPFLFNHPSLLLYSAPPRVVLGRELAPPALFYSDQRVPFCQLFLLLLNIYIYGNVSIVPKCLAQNQTHDLQKL